jgi:2-dehydro-3-deoxyphosphogluconate aldolase / (4S)-4-hydroxy-2-oxoglutarate aldolase
MNLAIEDVIGRSPVIAVLTIRQVAHAVPLARALLAGGLAVIEVTLRTPVALAAIARIKSEVAGAIVGAGTLLTPEDVLAARKAGADFLVSPGATPRLIAAAKDQSCPFLPGASTASEAMRLLEDGFRHQKFFPAEQSGGVAGLKALHAPLAEIVFCPTGGITAANAQAYLALPNVACVGASWPAPDAAVTALDWSGIEASARQAAGLPRHRKPHVALGHGQP